MPCSICHQQGHNKLKCPKIQILKCPTTQKKLCIPRDYTDTNILTFTTDVLNYIDIFEKSNMYYHLLTDVEPTTSHIMVSLSSEKETHCGYCSDNDGTTTSYNYDRDKIYIILPTELSKQLPALQKIIDDGYFNGYELPRHSQCYCGLDSIKNYIISLDIRTV